MAASDPAEILEELKRRAPLAALEKSIKDLTREIRRLRREQRELHDDEED